VIFLFRRPHPFTSSSCFMSLPRTIQWLLQTRILSPFFPYCCSFAAHRPLSLLVPNPLSEFLFYKVFRLFMPTDGVFFSSCNPKTSPAWPCPWTNWAPPSSCSEMAKRCAVRMPRRVFVSPFDSVSLSCCFFREGFDSAGSPLSRRRYNPAPLPRPVSDVNAFF